MGLKGKDYPKDYITCLGKFPRLVVACMHHCPANEYCQLFYQFFRDRRISPVEYYNEDGLGVEVMRRVVFDCDRCNKKDVSPIYSLYSPDGVGEDYSLPQELLKSMFDEFGYPYDPVGEAVVFMMKLMDSSLSWAHLCKPCFNRMVDDVAKQFKIKSSLTEMKIKKLESRTKEQTVVGDSVDGPKVAAQKT